MLNGRYDRMKCIWILQEELYMSQSTDKRDEITRGAYISSTLELINKYYERAQSAKRKHQILKLLIASGSVFIPVFVNLPGLGLAVIQWGTTIIGIIVAISVVVESVFGFRENWATYGSIPLFIDKEYHFFMYRVRDYANLDDETAFKLFVERIESELSNQHIALLEKQVRPKVDES